MAPKYKEFVLDMRETQPSRTPKNAHEQNPRAPVGRSVKKIQKNILKPRNSDYLGQGIKNAILIHARYKVYAKTNNIISPIMELPQVKSN